MLTSRRGFITGLGALAVAPAVSIDPGKWANLAFEAGNAMPYVGSLQNALRLCLPVLLDDMAAFLPPGARYDLRAAIPGYFGRHTHIAWYRHPRFDDEPEWQWLARPRVEDGYILIDRRVSP